MHPFNQRGFTLIELIVTLIVIAVLAVVAAPRFINLSEGATIASINGTASQFEQGISFAHSRWYVNGHSAVAFTNLPGYAESEDGDETKNLDMNDVGYPIGTDKADRLVEPYNIGRGHAGCTAIWDAIMVSDYTVSEQQGQIENVDFYTRRSQTTIPNEGQKWTQCYYIYTRSGFDTDPDVAKHVMWYDSRTGAVTTVHR